MNKKYDVIIIGAGIGGLIAASYLAKNGLMVLILEKNKRCGGYCQSFVRDGFEFEAGPHTIGSFNNGGLLKKIFNELAIQTSLEKSFFAERIVLNGNEYILSSNFQEMKETLKSLFSKEKDNIEDYFNDLFNMSDLFLSKKIAPKTSKMVYREFLDAYVNDLRLKTILSVHSNYLGVTPSDLSCLAMAMIERSYYMEGTYNFITSSSDFTKSIVEKFLEYGGNLQTGEEVNSVRISSDNGYNIISKNGKIFSGKNIVVNLDPLTFNSYFEKKNLLGNKFVSNLEKYSYTPTLLVSYLGVKTEAEKEEISGWYIYTDDLEKLLQKTCCVYAKRVNKKDLAIHVARFQHGCEPEKIDRRERQKHFKNETLKLLEQIKLRGKFEIKTMCFADRLTFRKWTNNRNGSAYGFSMNTKQAYSNIFNRLAEKKNISFVGHWSTYGGGIVSSALSGKDVATKILEK